MFMPAIVGQATDEQQKELLPKCNSLQIIGTYAQTELGHGTFVRVRSKRQPGPTAARLVTVPLTSAIPTWLANALTGSFS